MGIQQTQNIREMFSRIANSYDFMNSIMTVGQDTKWRREIVQRAALPQDGWLLDLGTGTGRLAKESLLQFPGRHIVAVDFTLDMMRTGKNKPAQILINDDSIGWCAADATCLPFHDLTFDSVISGFLLRNVIDLDQCLAAQFRVLKPGGRIVILDTTPPLSSPFSPLTLFYFRKVIPTMGKIIARNFKDYEYLSVSTENFLPPEKLRMRLDETGFQDVGFQRRMFGTIAIHWGVKPLTN